MRIGTISAGLAVAVAFVMACGGSQSSAPAAAAPSAAASPSGEPSAAPTASASASAAPAGASGATASGAGSAPSAAASATSDGGASPAAANPGDRPFANNALEAQGIIQTQIDAHMKQLWVCVNDYRTKKKTPHKEVVVAIGIDQEGNLLGITSANTKKHGDLDKTLKQCMFAALHGLPFPRSHAGVITVKQTFNDMTVYTQ